jgi:hypothetical protein
MSRSAKTFSHIDEFNDEYGRRFGSSRSFGGSSKFDFSFIKNKKLLYKVLAVFVFYFFILYYYKPKFVAAETFSSKSKWDFGNFKSENVKLDYVKMAKYAGGFTLVTMGILFYFKKHPLVSKYVFPEECETCIE